jgi:hypothetical protein
MFVPPNVLPEWVIWACGVLAVALLGKLGSSKDKPVISSRAVMGAQVQKLTSDNVVKRSRATASKGTAGLPTRGAATCHPSKQPRPPRPPQHARSTR